MKCRRKYLKMELLLGQKYEVVVRHIKPKKGIVVEFVGYEGEMTEFIHISKISDKFVVNIEDFVTCGEILVAECVEGLAHPLELSLKHLNLQPRTASKSCTSGRPTVGVISHGRRVASSYQSAIKEVERMMSKPSPTLDEMIADSNKVLQDKMKDRKARYDRK